MPLFLPESYPFKKDLTAQGIILRDGSRSGFLRIGFLNLMPEAEKYECSVLSRLGKSENDIEIIFIRSAVHPYSSSNHEHLDKFYITFDEALKKAPDGIIITGAPVEKIAFEEVRYWNELMDIMQYSFDNLKGTMGLCWGGMAMAKFLGIEKSVYQNKIFGIYLSENPETGEKFYCPHSRYAGFREEDLEKKHKEGIIRKLGYSDETGNFIISSKDKNFIAHIGHPEYTVERILFEYHRDKKLGLNTIPQHFDTENPKYSWEKSGTEFFTNWIKKISQV